MASQLLGTVRTVSTGEDVHVDMLHVIGRCPGHLFCDIEFTRILMTTYFLKVFVREKYLRTVRRRNVPRVRTAVMPSIQPK